ncbi:hypothetical protein BDK92_6544 [Micromonospora pisi]|uniref:Excreted virulence factor EspC (Type VII ESX diderm) n=1 Tax=Micromonospora pisi TaxID=589240 RepID=A0A495JUY3_9ACTN|nr:hypothetical protein [Micromonospora pisi]RKR92112.1 hypothetical protein BDK92_6544 [Micromonospora pisi]
MPDFEIQPDSVRATGESLLSGGSSFADQLAAFEQATAAYEGAWGDDTIGTYIGTAYVAVAQWALDCWYTVADEISSAGDDLNVMADAYEQTEKDIASMFDNFGRTLG